MVKDVAAATARTPVAMAAAQYKRERLKTGSRCEQQRSGGHTPGLHNGWKVDGSAGRGGLVEWLGWCGVAGKRVVVYCTGLIYLPASHQSTLCLHGETECVLPPWADAPSLVETGALSRGPNSVYLAGEERRQPKLCSASPDGPRGQLTDATAGGAPQSPVHAKRTCGERGCRATPISDGGLLETDVGPGGRHGRHRRTPYTDKRDAAQGGANGVKPSLAKDSCSPWDAQGHSMCVQYSDASRRYCTVASCPYAHSS